jgi:hypothetical protein
MPISLARVLKVMRKCGPHPGCGDAGPASYLSDLISILIKSNHRTSSTLHNLHLIEPATITSSLNSSRPPRTSSRANIQSETKAKMANNETSVQSAGPQAWRTSNAKKALEESLASPSSNLRNMIQSEKYTNLIVPINSTSFSASMQT